jgi:glycosyltransferase involved in cell wall biosynthesis
MKWLIVEDALRNKQGHWVEYINTFRDAFLAIGDSVEVLCDAGAEQWLIDKLDAKPVLPPSIWHRASDGASKWKRLARIPSHGWATFITLRRWFKSNPDSDIIFVPTVLVHHLLGWLFLINGPLRGSKSKLLLFFPNTPVCLDPTTGKGILAPEPTGRLFGWLIKCLGSAVKEGRVILGAETSSMRQALEEATGVPFVYLPHPVPVFFVPESKIRPLTMAVYGPARFEKGSDALQEAISRYLRSMPENKTNFVIQWLDDFLDNHGKMIAKDPDLAVNPQVEYITSYFEPGEYPRRLSRTDVLMLPYRKSSYDLRVSRVVIEAMVHGIPVIATKGTTLAIQAEEYGACVTCEDGSVESLMAAICEAVDHHTVLKTKAEGLATTAAVHFSVNTFRNIALHHLNQSL